MEHELLSRRRRTYFRCGVFGKTDGFRRNHADNFGVFGKVGLRVHEIETLAPEANTFGFRVGAGAGAWEEFVVPCDVAP